MGSAFKILSKQGKELQVSKTVTSLGWNRIVFRSLQPRKIKNVNIGKRYRIKVAANT